MEQRPQESPTYELAQLNIARLLAPLESPQLAEFVAGLEPVNAAAEAAPGFVWRLKDEATDDATSLRPFEDDWIIVNLTVWTSPEALRAFVYDDAHRAFLRRRREWFERLAEAVTVLWWVPAGARPTIVDARKRLVHLRERGKTEHAFGLTDTVPPPAPGTEYPPQ